MGFPFGCDWCATSTIATTCPGQDEHCRLGQHCTSTCEVCALEWRRGENPGGHPRNCEHCDAPLRDHTSPARTGRGLHHPTPRYGDTK